ncbi:MAG TPA: hypothetical protein VF665_06015 [Longimicrobium sp.]|uniref:hypothetical protein n=1 Tax=Longimicrobium sp. TaxID=2029185 RepID=UPI002EDA07A1
MIPVMLRGMLPRLALVALAGWMFYLLEPGFHEHATELAGEEVGLNLGYLGIAASLSNLSAFSMLILLGGSLSGDRANGWYRMYFAHPTRPLAYYGVQWLLALVLSVAASAVFLVVGQIAAWGEFQGGWSGLWLALLAAISYGGMIAVLSVLIRGDTWVALILYITNYVWLQAISLGVQPVPGGFADVLALLLPPQLALSDVFDGILAGQIAWVPSAYAAGYGLFWLIVAGVLLRMREWP